MKVGQQAGWAGPSEGLPGKAWDLPRALERQD